MWKIDDEINFFKNSLNGNFANTNKIFYNIQGKNLAYIPKGVNIKPPTLQSRNSLIGNYTETWCQKLLSNIAKKFNLFAVNNVICQEIGLISSSSADLAFCTTPDIIQEPKNIKIIFEIKMSIVNNYELKSNGEIVYIGDKNTHIASPSLIRSDSVLKAIGKAINIRVSGSEAEKIPFVILGNTNISKNYEIKIDNLGQSGVLQKVLNLNSDNNLKCNSPLKILQTPKNTSELENILSDILKQDLHYFSAMIDKEKLSKIIKKSANEKEVANTFLKLIKEINN